MLQRCCSCVAVTLRLRCSGGAGARCGYAATATPLGPACCSAAAALLRRCCGDAAATATGPEVFAIAFCLIQVIGSDEKIGISVHRIPDRVNFVLPSSTSNGSI
jgi:hypothetical protein